MEIFVLSPTHALKMSFFMLATNNSKNKKSYFRVNLIENSIDHHNPMMSG